MTLHIDIETYSSRDIKTCGLYKYVEAPDFQVLLIAYAIGNGPVKVLDLTDGLPALFTNTTVTPGDAREFISHYTNPNVTLAAHNATFERICLDRHYGIRTPIDRWHCTMVKAAQCALPLSLDAAAKALGLEQRKDAAGKALLRYFSQPDKHGRRRTADSAPDKWQALMAYCAQDVEVERAIDKALAWHTPHHLERHIYALDQRINDRGIMIDADLVRAAITMDAQQRETLEAEAVALTGLTNPNSVQQLRSWLEDETGSEVKTLAKATVADLITEQTGAALRVLEIRQELSKTSIKKYEAMRSVMCDDSRARGLLQYYGSRTGRWAGRLVQLQNLPQNHLPYLDTARTLARDGDSETLAFFYGSVSDTLSQLIRTALIPAPGHKFIIIDFSAIEARVLAWLAGETWRIDVFNTHGKIYEASASAMFSVPLESITKGSALRQKGKIAELALGYGGGNGALEQMGAIKMGLQHDELPRLVAAWRKANKAIVKYWNEVEGAVINALQRGGSWSAGAAGAVVTFYTQAGHLICRLPSGRELVYQSAYLVDSTYGPQIKYKGIDQLTRKWVNVSTYGGKLVENITQAVARDCMANTLLQLDAEGYSIVMHVHDEGVIEEPLDGRSVKDAEAVMVQPAPWMKGLPLAADGFEAQFYQK